MKKISIIGTVGIPARYGGFETFADNLVKDLSNKNEFIVFCSKKHYKNRENSYFCAKRIFLPLKANGIQSIPYDIISIIISLFKSDTLLILGISGCIILPIIKPFHRKKIIVTLDGLDSKRKKWSKYSKWFLEISERCAVKYADVIVSDNHIIQKYIKSKYNKESRLIEYSGNHSHCVKPNNTEFQKYPFLKGKYALSISRVEPENNCDLILNTFKQLNDIKLVYIGTWNNNKYSRSLKEKFKFNPNIVLLDAIFDIEIINLIRSNCTVFIHGNSVGGTNPGLVEAMYVGLPILAYDVDFNRITTEGNAIFFSNQQQLTDGLTQYLNNYELLIKNKIKVKEIAVIRYDKYKIFKKYDNIF